MADQTTADGTPWRRQRHRWVTIPSDGSDPPFLTCPKCGLDKEDTFIWRHVGCTAGPEGNEPGYIGFALTPKEQARGFTGIDTMFIRLFGFPDPIDPWPYSRIREELERMREESGKWPTEHEIEAADMDEMLAAIRGTVGLELICTPAHIGRT